MTRSPDEGAQSDALDARLVAAFERLAAAMRQQFATVAREHRLSPLQAQILTYLSALETQHPDGVTLGQLVSALSLVPGTVSEAVSALVNKGLVLRRPDATDRRAVRLRLSAKGKRAVARLSSWTSIFRDALRGLSFEQKAQVYQSILRIVDELQKRGAIPPQRMCFRCAFFQEPDFCQFLNRTLAPVELQIDCPDFVARETQ